HTALAIVLLASGVLTARPNVGFVAALTCEHAGGMVARRHLLGLLVLAPIALIVVRGHRLGWYGDSAVSAWRVLRAPVGRAGLSVVTACPLNARDIRQKATEQLWRRSEQRMSELYNQAPDGILVADLTGRYIDVNDAACRLLDRPREEIVGKYI